MRRKLANIRPEKSRTEVIVAAMFAHRMGLSPNAVLFDYTHTDGDRVDARLELKDRLVVLELTMADPEGSGSLPDQQKGESILTGSIRAAWKSLFEAFDRSEPSCRKHDVQLRFQSVANRIELPRAAERSQFVAELHELSAKAAEG